MAESQNRTRRKMLILCIAIGCLFIAGALVIYGMPFSGRAPRIGISISHKTGNESHYTVFHATTQQQLTDGLMNYTFDNCTSDQTSSNGPCEDNVVGELFSFGDVMNACFWMENTPEPLVQAWISGNGTVSYIYDGVPYSTNVVCADGSAVLELGRNLGIPLQVGDVVKAG